MAVIGAKGNLPGSRGSFEDDAEEKEFVCTQVMEFCHVHRNMALKLSCSGNSLSSLIEIETNGN